MKISQRWFQPYQGAKIWTTKTYWYEIVKPKPIIHPILLIVNTRTTLVDTWLIIVINYEIGKQWFFFPYPYIIHVAWCVEHIHSDGVESTCRSFTIISLLYQHNKIISGNNLELIEYPSLIMCLKLDEV